MHILSVPRLKRLIQCLFLILIGLFIGLISVLHQTVIFRSPSTAFVSSYNLGRVRTKTSSSLKSQNLIQGSILQTYYNKIFVSKCENLSPTEFPEPNQSKFWISIDDGFESHVRPTSYFDVRRVQNDVEYPSVKILASSQRRNLTDAIFCSIPKSETEILSVPATASEIWFSKWNANATNDVYHSFIIDCPIPLDMKEVPKVIFVSSESCDVTYPLAVEAPGLLGYLQNDRKPSGGVCVCVKPFDFPADISPWMVEWIEANKLLGAEKIVIYVYVWHPNVKKVLEYYQNEGLVELRHWELPGKLPNDASERKEFHRTNIWQKRRSEILPYNECFYEGIYKYKFVLPVDIDEIVFPLKFDDWNGLLQHVFESDKTAEATIGSFSVRNAQFFKRQNFSQDFGPFGGKLLTAEIIERNVKLSKPGTRVKSFVNTQVGELVFNHYAFGTVLKHQLKNIHLSPELVQMNHYRDACTAQKLSKCSKDSLEPKIEDAKFVEKFGDILLERVENVLRSVELYRDD